MDVKNRKFSISLLLSIVWSWLLLTTAGWAQDNALTNGTGSASEPINQVPDDSESITQGRSLFGQHCTVCHAVGKQVIGPALASVQNRRPIDWLVSFIQNSQHVIIDQEDEYAQHLYQQYEQQVMPNFEFLSRDEILDILAYIQVESSSTTAGVSSISEAQAEITQNEPAKEETINSAISSSNSLTIILVGIILVLIAVIVVLATRNRTKTNA